MAGTPYHVEHPDYRPGRGEKRSDRQITLNAEAGDAYRVWAAIWANRRAGEDTYKGIRQDAVERIVADGGLLGDLLLIAVGDATTRPVRPLQGWGPGTTRVEWDRERFAAYEMAGVLRDRYAAVAAPVASLVPAGYNDDTCRHGRPYSGDCADCEV